MSKILLDHGSGGAATQELLGELFLKHLSSPVLHCLEDSALLGDHDGRLAFSTDCYISEPVFFPGGNIGLLAVNGTINNLAMRGAMPLALSLGIVVEEGFPYEDMEKIIESIGIASKIAGVAVVTGDTKVVPKDKIKGICVNTSGIGLVGEGVEVSSANAQVEDAIIISGNIGEHGLALQCQEMNATFCSSSIRPLHHMVKELLESFPDSLHALRDPTRGGVATSLVWLASGSGVCLEIDEAAIPISSNVEQFCRENSVDPFYLNSDGVCIACCDSEFALEIVSMMRTMESGRNARIIGHVSNSPMGRVRLHRKNGAASFLDALA